MPRKGSSNPTVKRPKRITTKQIIARKKNIIVARASKKRSAKKVSGRSNTTGKAKSIAKISGKGGVKTSGKQVKKMP